MTAGACVDRLRSVIEGRLVTGPETLQINLRNACNLNCVFCWNHSPLVEKRPASFHRQRLSDRHLDAVLGALPKLRPGRVLLSGRGEPLLHERAGEALAALRCLHIPVVVQTNGVAGVSVEELCASRVERLLVNVAAATPDGYERTHPGRGHLLEDVLGRLERLALARREGFAPKVTLVAVIQRTNHDEILPLVELAERVGADSVHLRGLEHSPEITSLALDESSERIALEQIRAATVEGPRRGIAVNANHLRRWIGLGAGATTTAGGAGSLPCYMGWYYLRITCDGRVMFCCKDKPVGHLDHGSLYEIWRFPGYHLLRLAGRDRDATAGLFDQKCAGCSNFARNREVHAELSTRA